MASKKVVDPETGKKYKVDKEDLRPTSKSSDPGWIFGAILGTSGATAALPPSKSRDEK